MRQLGVWRCLLQLEVEGTGHCSAHLAGLETWLKHLSPLLHLGLINRELKHGEPRKCPEDIFQTPLMQVPQSMADTKHGYFVPFLTSFSPQCFLLSPLCAPAHEFPFLSCPKILLSTSFNLILYSTWGSLPWFLTIYQSQACLPYLTAPHLLLLLFACFKSQQKNWLRTPRLIIIGTTNIPSLGTNWHEWSPAEIRNKLILWRCLPLKQFLVS